ncbi:hypothetical protein CA606_09000 [Caulobacter vibrioides]|uniref:Uncharacterized protein n=1 Tax=Caulobacter vibrioides TaxID=155892 RepID=A0A290MK79_CAUVI|nr:hypothetical protein [Caulobacter vibrioides]ATC32475.1 hypothetical protein CA606_09000 [Caulobacter vibrioides]
MSQRKTFKTLVVAGLGLALIAAATPAFAREKIIPADKLFPYLDKFMKVPAQERSRMRLRYVLRSEGKPFGGVKVSLVETNGATTVLPVGDDGEFDRLPTLAQLNGKAKVVVDVPADKKFGISMIPAPVLKLAQEYDARDLALTVSESNAAMRKAAGPALSLMVPKLPGIGFIGAQSGQIVYGDGRQAALEIVGGVPVFYPEAHKGAARVKLSRTPTRVAFDDGKK